MDCQTRLRLFACCLFLLASAHGQWPTEGISLIGLEPREARLVLEPGLGPMVRFQDDRGKAEMSEIRSSGTLGVAHLTGLLPDHVYRATVGQRQIRFRTPSETQERFRLAIVGHTGGTSPRQKHSPESLVARLRAERPDGVFHAGDAVYACNENAFIEEFFRLFAPVMENVPVWLAPGNHECGFPSATLDYQTFKRALPYPFPAEALSPEAPPFYEVQRGSLRILVLCYYRKALLPGTVQHAWLMGRLQDDRSTFTALVMGMGPSTFPERDAVMASLPAGKVDLIIGGDGEGCSLSTHTTPTILFNGSGGTGPHPLTMLQIDPHELVLNTYTGDDQIAHHRVIRDRRIYPAILDARGALASGLLEGVSLDPKTGALLRGELTGTILVASSELKPLAASPRGIQVSLAIACDETVAGLREANIYLAYRPRGHPDPRFRVRSQPMRLPMNGKPQLIHVPVGASGSSVPEAVGFIMEHPPENLRSITVDRFEVF